MMHANNFVLNDSTNIRFQLIDNTASWMRAFRKSWLFHNHSSKGKIIDTLKDLLKVYSEDDNG